MCAKLIRKLFFLKIILKNQDFKMFFYSFFRSNSVIILIGSMLYLYSFCTLAQNTTEIISKTYQPGEVKCGDERLSEYIPLLKGKKVAVVANHSAMIYKTHLVDTLLSLDIDVLKIFAPEHGFRGIADAGQTIGNYTDKKTDIPVVSLYGKKKKPTKEDLKNIDLVVFDIQDVGARFYTYISTLHYVMEACAEQNKTLLVLDRPNPNGHYVDGPVLEDGFHSFIGMDPVPIVHGMTIAEYARMLNGESWLTNGEQCKLICIPCKNYNHSGYYELPVAPSPNLPNMSSVYLYPSLCLFEGTAISVGRGTDKPFQLIGHPKLKNTRTDFKPMSIPGAKHPKYEREICHGFDLSEFGQIFIKTYDKLYLYWLLSFYKEFPDKEHFFNDNNMFNLLAGNDKLMKQIKDGMSEQEIRNSWQPELEKFLKIRAKYLLYKDFKQE